MTPSPSPPAMPAMPAELGAERLRELREIVRANVPSTWPANADMLALIDAALSRQEQPADKPFPTTTNTPNHSRLVGWLPVRPDGPWEQRWHGSGEDRGDHVFLNGEHVAFFGDKQHDAVSILVHALNLWEAAK